MNAVGSQSDPQNNVFVAFVLPSSSPQMLKIHHTDTSPVCQLFYYTAFLPAEALRRFVLLSSCRSAMA